MTPTKTSGRFAISRRMATTPSTAAPVKSVPDASIFWPSSLSAPAAGAVEVLEREPDRVHHPMAARTGR
jgi:hypothetical protein